MEAVALALGWNSADGEFRFQPFHIHRSIHLATSPAPAISIVLEFRESAPGAWDGDGFETLREALPDALNDPRHFWLEVTHDCGGGTSWTFLATIARPVVNDLAMLSGLCAPDAGPLVNGRDVGGGCAADCPPVVR